MSAAYTVIKTTRFKRDYKRLQKQGRDMTELNAAIGELAFATVEEAFEYLW